MISVGLFVLGIYVGNQLATAVQLNWPNIR